MKYLTHILIALDQLLTALVGGYPDETLSSYAYRLEQQGRLWGLFWRPVIDTLFWWQDSHCRAAFESERARYQLPPELRGLR